MGNKQPKLERKFSSLPAQSFPHARNMSDPSFLRKLSKDAAKERHNLDLEKESYPQEGDVPFTDYMFLPTFTLQGDITEDSFDVIGVIAKGAFGDVLKVRKFEDQIVYAMKVMKKSQVLVDGAVQQCKDEASIHEYVGYHPFVVKAHNFFQSKENICIVMDFIPRGELFGVWKRLDRFSEELVRIYVAELALVLDFLHDSKIVYRDMKMENILIDAQGNLKVTDFGLSKWLKKGEVTRTICGTLNYIAPEVLGMKPYGHPADWWSLGIVMYALLLGQFPVPQTNNHFEMAKQVEYHTYRVPQRHGISVEAIACGEQLLQKDPNERIQELQELLEQAFFHDFDVDGIFSGHIRPIDYYESEDVFLYPVMANDPARMQEFHGGKNTGTGTMTRSQSADFLNEKSQLHAGKEEKPSYHGTFDCFDEPLPSPGNVNFGSIESDYLTNKAAQALRKEQNADGSREPVENSCHGSSKTNSLKSNQDMQMPGNRDSVLSNSSNQGGFPQYNNRHSGSSLDRVDKTQPPDVTMTWAKRNSGHHEGYSASVNKPLLPYKKEYSAPVEHSFVECVNDQTNNKSGQRDGRATVSNNNTSGYHQYQTNMSATSPASRIQNRDGISPTSRFPVKGDKTSPSNATTTGYYRHSGSSLSAQQSQQDTSKQNSSKNAGYGTNAGRVSGSSINVNFQNTSVLPGNRDQLSQQTKTQSTKRQQPHTTPGSQQPHTTPSSQQQHTTPSSQQPHTTPGSQQFSSQLSNTALPRYGGMVSDSQRTEEFGKNPLHSNRNSEFGPVTIQNPGYIARSSSASEGYTETESFISYSDKPADPSSARFSMPININRNQWAANPVSGYNQEEMTSGVIRGGSKRDQKLRQSTDTSGTEDSHSCDDVASSKRDSCGDGSSTIHSIKDNKILYSEKTKPKRTKSQEHLPTWKRAKSPAESSEPTVALRPIIHVRNRSLDEVGRFSTMHKKKDSYRDAIFNQSKWLINLSMDAEAKHSLSKSSSKNSSTDNLLRRHSSEEDILGKFGPQHQGLSMKTRPSSENMTQHVRHSKTEQWGDNAEVFEQGNTRKGRQEFTEASNVRNNKERSSGRSRTRYHHQLAVEDKPQVTTEHGFQNRNQKQRSSGRKRRDNQTKHENNNQESIRRALVRNRSTGDFLETDIDEIMGLVPVGSTKKRKELAAQRTHSDSHLLETDIDAVMHEKIAHERKPRKPIHKRESYRSAVKMHEVKQPQLKSQPPWGGQIVEASLDGSFEKHEPVKGQVKKMEASKKSVETNVDTYQSSVKSESLSSKGGRKGKKFKNPGPQTGNQPIKYQDELEYLESASRTRDSYYAAVNTASDERKPGLRHDYVNADRYGNGMMQYPDQDMPLGMSANQQNFLDIQRKEQTKALQPSQPAVVVPDTSGATAKPVTSGKKVPSSISESQLHRYLHRPYQDHATTGPIPVSDVAPPKPPRSTDMYELQKSKSGPALNQLDEAAPNSPDPVKSPEINVKIHRSYGGDGNESDASHSRVKESVGNTQRSMASMREQDDGNTSNFRVLKSYQNLQNPRSRPWEKPRPMSRDIVPGNMPEPMTVKAKIQSLADLETWNSPSVMTPAHKSEGRLQTSKSVGDMLSYGVKEDSLTNEDAEIASVQAKKKLFEQSDMVFQPKKYERNSTQLTSPRLPISELTNSALYNSSSRSRIPLQSQSSSSLANPPTSPLFDQSKPGTMVKSIAELSKDRPMIAPKPKAQASPNVPSPRGRIIPRSENVAPEGTKTHNIPERMPIVRSKSTDEHFGYPSPSPQVTKTNPLGNSSSSHEVRNFHDPQITPTGHHSDIDLNKIVDTHEARTVFKTTLAELPLNQQPHVSLSRKSSQASDISHSYINMGTNSSSELIASILSQEINTLDNKPKKDRDILKLQKKTTSESGGFSKTIEPAGKPKPAPRPSKAGNPLVSPRLVPPPAHSDVQGMPQYSNVVNPIKLTDNDKIQHSLSQDTAKTSHQQQDQNSFQGRPILSPATAMHRTDPTDQAVRDRASGQSAHYYNLDFSSRASAHSGDSKSDGYMYPDPAHELNLQELEHARQHIPDYENMPRNLNPQLRSSTKNRSQGQISTASSSSSDTFPKYMQMSPSSKSGHRGQDKQVNNKISNFPENHPDYVNVLSSRDTNQRPCLSPTHSDHAAVSSPNQQQRYTSGSSHMGHSRQNSKDSSRSLHSLHSPVPLNTGFVEVSSQQTRLVSPRGFSGAKDTKQQQQYASSSPSPVLNKSGLDLLVSSKVSESSPSSVSRTPGVSSPPQNVTAASHRPRWTDKVPVTSSTADVSNLTHSHMSINDSGASSGDLSCGSFHDNTTDVVFQNRGYQAPSPSSSGVMYRQESHGTMCNRQLSSPAYKASDDHLTLTSPPQSSSGGNWSHHRPLQSPSGLSNNALSSASTTSGQFEDSGQQQHIANRQMQDLSRPVPSPRYTTTTSGGDGAMYHPQRHSTHGGAWPTEAEAGGDRASELHEGVVMRERSKSQSGESQTDPDSAKDLSWSESITSLSGMVV